MKKILKIVSVLYRDFLKMSGYLNNTFYMKHYTSYLRKKGVVIKGIPKYISQSAYFDGADYSKIIIGDKVTISREVMFLTHDFSITNGLRSIDGQYGANGGSACYLKEIHIGDNSFIGARASLLPGANVGNNCIIGACSVVKGKVPDNSIVIGNPAKVVGNTQEWATKRMELFDYTFR